MQGAWFCHLYTYIHYITLRYVTLHYIHTYLPTFLPSYLPTYLHTYIHTYTHIYILYIYIYIVDHSWFVSQLVLHCSAIGLAARCPCLAGSWYCPWMSMPHHGTRIHMSDFSGGRHGTRILEPNVLDERHLWLEFLGLWWLCFAGRVAGGLLGHLKHLETYVADQKPQVPPCILTCAG